MFSQNDGRGVSSKKLAASAYHEAGHIVAACIHQRWPTRAQVWDVEDGYAGKVEYAETPDWVERPHLFTGQVCSSDLDAQVIQLMAGAIAHDQRFPELAPDPGAKNDERHINELLIPLLEGDHAAYRVLIHERTLLLLLQQWNAIEAIAAALTEQGDLDAEEIETLFHLHRGGPPPLSPPSTPADSPPSS